MHSAAGIDNNGVSDILRGWIKRPLQFNLLWLMLLNKFIEADGTEAYHFRCYCQLTWRRIWKIVTRPYYHQNCDVSRYPNGPSQKIQISISTFTIHEKWQLWKMDRRHNVVCFTHSWNIGQVCLSVCNTPSLTAFL